MDLGLKDKVVVVTGGGSGIGAAITETCLQEGARVLVLTRLSAGVEDFVARQQHLGRPCELRVAELSEPDQCRAALEHLSTRYGWLDALVNNAGCNDSVGLESGDVTRFERSLRNNLTPAYTLTHHALPLLKASRGTVVNIASKVALTGQGNTSGYAAAKGGLLALTREWAAELLPFGIRVNAVIPAEVMTPAYESWLSTLPHPEDLVHSIKQQIPLAQRMTTPQEIASAVAFLLSPTHSAHTTGQHLFVDGGYVHLDRMLTANPLR